MEMFDKLLNERVNYIIGMKTMVTTTENLKAYREGPDLRAGGGGEATQTLASLKLAMLRWWDCGGVFYFVLLKFVLGMHV